MLALRAAIDRPGTEPVGKPAPELTLEPRAKVLCAIDALSQSDAAVRRAYTVARNLGAQLHLLHVVDSTQAMSAAGRRGALARFNLNARARELAHWKTGALLSIRDGRPHAVIAEVASEWGADLIVLGSYQRRFGDALLGTAAERIAHKTARPVLVVNSEDTGPYQHVLLTSDLSDAAVGIARVTKQLGLLQRSRASVVHALERTRSAMLYRAGISESEARVYRHSLDQLAWDEIDMQLFSAGLDSAYFGVFSPQVSPVRAIEQVAQRVGADLIVVGSSRFPELKRVFLGSMSNEVLRRAKHDVLLVSPGAARRTRKRPVTMQWHRGGEDDAAKHSLLLNRETLGPMPVTN